MFGAATMRWGIVLPSHWPLALSLRFLLLPSSEGERRSKNHSKGFLVVIHSNKRESSRSAEELCPPEILMSDVTCRRNREKRGHHARRREGDALSCRIILSVRLPPVQFPCLPQSGRSGRSRDSNPGGAISIRLSRWMLALLPNQRMGP